MDKDTLRLKYKQLRKQLSKTEIEKMSVSIANNVLPMPIWDNVFYHIFLSIVPQNEVETKMLIDFLRKKNKKIVVSKSDFNSLEMTHFLFENDIQIQLNNYFIPEPNNGVVVPLDAIDVVFLPLLAFDKLGNRVGYGKGFYDKFLSNCRVDTIKIGLSFFKPEELILGMNDNDIRLDFCVTPESVYNFTV